MGDEHRDADDADQREVRVDVAPLRFARDHFYLTDRFPQVERIKGDRNGEIDGLKDRARADTDFKVNLKNEVNIETLLRELSEMRAELRERGGQSPTH